MSGKFINTKYKQAVKDLTQGFQNNMENPWYMFTENKPTLCTYYNMNKEKTSLDKDLETNYDVLGKNSPLKFNRIKDFCIYGMDKIAADLDVGDFGLESSSIEGDALILPNTITPYPNDYFTINYDKHSVMFKVLSVTVDTIENGVNFYKIEYKLDQPDDSRILDQLIDDYTMIIDNVGTQMKSIIKKDSFDYIEKLDTVCTKLKMYYKSLFYSERVQTFIFNYNDTNFYDPYMIEFIIRNNILIGIGEYVYVEHQLPLKHTFPIDYDKTFLRFIEYTDLEGRKPLTLVQGRYIVDDQINIFSTRKENYFCIEYININKDYITNEYNFAFNVVDLDLLDNIFKNNKYKESTYKNIIIKLLNNEKIEPDDIFSLEKIDFDHTLELFYMIPILIYLLEGVIKNILTVSK